MAVLADTLAGWLLGTASAAIAAYFVASSIVALAELAGLVYSPAAEERAHRGEAPAVLSVAARRGS